LWIAWILRDPKLFHDQFFGNLRLIQHIGASDTIFHRLFGPISDVFISHRYAPFVPVLAGLAVVWLFLRRRDARIMVIALFVVPLLFLWERNALSERYSVYIVTFASIFAGWGAAEMWETETTGTRRRIYRAAVGGGIALLLFGGALNGIVTRYYVLCQDWPLRDYDRFARDIRALVPPGQKVIAMPEAWYALHDAGCRSYFPAILRTPEREDITYVVEGPSQLAEPDETAMIAAFIKDNCEEIGRVGKDFTPSPSRTRGYYAICYRVVGPKPANIDTPGK
jgi:hypothetical protein